MNKPFDIERTVHLCLDMQQMFGPDGVWHTPWMERALPHVVVIAEQFAERNVFTRFIPPMHAEDCGGVWRTFYRKWENVTRSRLPAGQLSLMSALEIFASQGIIFEKSTYSAFHDGRLHNLLQSRLVTTLVMTGAETDVCVLATVMQAIDHGYRVILVEDALCSSSDKGHDSLMAMYRERLSLQLELATTSEIYACFR